MRAELTIGQATFEVTVHGRTATITLAETGDPELALGSQASVRDTSVPAAAELEESP